MFNQEAFNEEISVFCKLVDTSIQELITNKGNQPGIHYFNSTFHQYMQRVNPAANDLVNKYELELSSIAFSQFKELLQQRVEQGLQWYYFKLTYNSKP